MLSGLFHLANIVRFLSKIKHFLSNIAEVIISLLINKMIPTFKLPNSQHYHFLNFSSKHRELSSMFILISYNVIIIIHMCS